ncbi:MAG: aminotransferase class III-fold pyridoxal phosphate-dependent enzyme [Candidatus Hydrogenedentes bacterium]|nr:aminotransferase class III-fold pyridoxal phosphate-dependent enzyme [Candidatus Hydrogenedentota bacterium]
MDPYTFDKTAAWMERASRVIPGGIYGHFGPAPYVPVSAYPFFSDRAEGAYFWDVDGNRFIDYMCAYGPMIQGYRNPVVDAAYRAQMEKCDVNSVCAPVMVELAEYLTELVPAADWAFFAKNGADVTNLAVMTARAATGRKKIVAIKGGYHGTSPWMQGPGHHGVIEEDTANIIRIPWNDVEALERVVADSPGQIAGFISSPLHHPIFTDNELPAPHYWERVEALLRANGIVFIIDDVRAGFRLHMGGSCEHYGFTPDLICFCKAIGNGYPISALVGGDALRGDVSKVFHTGSYWYGAGPMAAALANLQELRRINGPRLLSETGGLLAAGMVDAARSNGFDLRISGEPSMLYARITDDPTLEMQQRWCGECARRGVFITSHHNWFVSTAHTRKDIEDTVAVCDEAFKAVRAFYGSGI